MNCQPHLIYYRENAKSDYFHLYAVESTPIQMDSVPETITVKKLQKYQEMWDYYQNMPLFTLATGKKCQTYTLKNWSSIKSVKRYEFQSKNIAPKYCPEDLRSDMVLIPYYAHVAWYSTKNKGVDWERESILWVESLHILLPKKIHIERDVCHVLKKKFKDLFWTLCKKNKLLLNAYTNDEMATGHDERGSTQCC